MSAHGMKLARWSLWFWHDYLLITFCKLRRVGLAARRGLLAACLPTKFAHKASKNNFIDKSSSEGRGRAKPKSVDGLTSSCPNIHTCSEVTNIHIIRMESFGLLYIRDPRPKPCCFPHFLQIQFPVSSHLYPPPVPALSHTWSLPLFHELDAFNPTWSFRALLPLACELRIPWFPAQRWQGVPSHWWLCEKIQAEVCPAAFPCPAFSACFYSPSISCWFPHNS